MLLSTDQPTVTLISHLLLPSSSPVQTPCPSPHHGLCKCCKRQHMQSLSQHIGYVFCAYLHFGHFLDQFSASHVFHLKLLYLCLGGLLGLAHRTAMVTLQGSQRTEFTPVSRSGGTFISLNILRAISGS